MQQKQRLMNCMCARLFARAFLCVFVAHLCEWNEQCTHLSQYSDTDVRENVHSAVVVFWLMVCCVSVWLNYYRWYSKSVYVGIGGFTIFSHSVVEGAWIWVIAFWKNHVNVTTWLYLYKLHMASHTHAHTDDRLKGLRNEPATFNSSRLLFALRKVWPFVFVHFKREEKKRAGIFMRACLGQVCFTWLA